MPRIHSQQRALGGRKMRNSQDWITPETRLGYVYVCVRLLQRALGMHAGCNGDELCANCGILHTIGSVD